MNIQEAKQEIIRTVRAYTAKDECGGRRIPAAQERPLLLIGPPGIGKSAVMEQAARECGVGILSYTITHHTRQSAVGLPQLVTRQFGGKPYTMTEYTMSEIIGSVYEYMERTGRREGILFLDEINCVSETLAPTMLEFLQYKRFGSHRVPEGWILAAAGNPPEYNRAVRPLDMAALDRVRLIEVEADFAVWRDYAWARGLHPAVLSYLELHPEQFYRVTLTRDRQEFVTARGWEDLSVTLKEYERQGFSADRDFMAEFLRVPEVASDFLFYYRLCQTHAGSWELEKLLDGSLSGEARQAFIEKLRAASGDIRCMFTRHLLSAAGARMTACGEAGRLLHRKREVLSQLLAYGKEADADVPGGFLKRRAHALRVKRENDLLKPWEDRMERAVDAWLAAFLSGEGVRCLSSGEPPEGPAGLPVEEEKLLRQREELQSALGCVTDFLRETFGEGQELTDWYYGLSRHGDFKACGFERPELFRMISLKEQEERLRETIKEMENLYETFDSV